VKIRLFKRFSLGPFVRVAITNAGVSLSVGHRSVGWLTFGKKGLSETLDTGVSGVYLRDSQPWSQLRRWIRHK
jgi:hypothetical protein